MSFTVTIQPANRSFSVERDEPILAAAIRQGIGLPYGCRDGACGSCKSRLLDGRVIHGAHQLKALSVAEEEAGLILTCCAVPQTDCVVEARSVPGAGEYPVLKMPSRVLSLVRAAPGKVILNHLEALDHCPIRRDALRSRLESEGVAPRVWIPEDGEVCELYGAATPTPTLLPGAPAPDFRKWLTAKLA